MSTGMPRVGANATPILPTQPRSPLIRIGDVVLNSSYIVAVVPSDNGAAITVRLHDGYWRTFADPEDVAAIRGYLDFLAWDVSIFAKKDLAKPQES